jgi:hypothetical protein
MQGAITFPSEFWTDKITETKELQEKGIEGVVLGTQAESAGIERSRKHVRFVLLT